MMVVNTGPSLKELKAALGVQGAHVTFGAHDTILTGTVDTMAAVGHWDSPVDMPYSTDNPATLWYVGGQYIDDGAPSTETYASLVSMNDNGEFQVAAVVMSLEQDIAFDCGERLLQAFADGMKANLQRRPFMQD